MKQEKHTAPDIFISESPATNREGDTDGRQRQGILKKAAILILMGIVFLGCLYLIFTPSEEVLEKENLGKGVNQDVPQATEAGMPADKGKAYEQQLVKEKNEQHRKAMGSLSEYWQQAAAMDTSAKLSRSPTTESVPGYQDYRSMRQSLGSFYEKQDNSQLEKEVASLKLQIANSKTRPPTTESPLALMEKSYQMASKYFPGPAVARDSVAAPSKKGEEPFTPVYKNMKGVVSSLTSTAISGWNDTAAGVSAGNSLRACVHNTQTVIPGQPVYLRLLEQATVSGQILAEGILLTAFAKFDTGRLQLQVISIETQGRILPVNLTVYDRDGQKGLHIPYAPEVGALNQMASNMSTTGGTSIMVTRSAGQQMAGDLSRGAIQGISGYLSKKVKTPKVQLPASYEVLLVSKK